MSPGDSDRARRRWYRLALTLPFVGFFTGALLFVIPQAILDRPPNLVASIGLTLVSWAAGLLVSLIVKCPRCGKSPYERVIPETGRPLFFPKVWGAPWPERICSRCGLEVGAGK